MTARPARAPRILVGLAALLLVAGGLGSMLSGGIASADTAPLDPTNPATPTTVSVDPLPTAQMNGVAWAQVVIGNTVYVGGNFTSARPAGAPAGTQEVPRNNLLAYDIRTGALISSFAPNLNGQVLALAASPDGSVLYAGGEFTTADGQDRWRLAAYSTATGQLISTWHPAVGGQVWALTATSSTVYIGGQFTAVGGAARNNLAAVNASDGGLQPWAPQPGFGPTSGNWMPGDPNGQNEQVRDTVLAMVAVNNGAQVVAAGAFYSMNGAITPGIAALDPVSGATRTYAINQLVTNQGINSAIETLNTDGKYVYGGGYDFYGPGNVEGVFAIDPMSGQLAWLDDCHGDTYSSFATNGALYVAGHPHDCSSIGGFPNIVPSRYSLAFSLVATGKVGQPTVGNNNFLGQPAPGLQSWFPNFAEGTVTSQSQSVWTISGNSQYVVFGGEFPSINGTPQAGLVRMAMPNIAPNKVGPQTSTGLTPSVASFAAGTARVSWSATWDQDNANLTYSVYRNDRPSTPIYQTTAASTFWQTPRLGFLDTSATPGASYTYSVTATDPFGNSVTSAASAPVTIATTGNAGGKYDATVRADGASDLWRLDESSGTIYDYAAAGLDMTPTGVTTGQTGALFGDSDTADSFSGSSSSYASTQAAIPGPQTFSLEAWVKTTTTSGGKILGFGNQATGNSSNYDRHLYLDNSGKLYFGVYPGSMQTVQSTQPINDGQYHYVVGTLSSQGMALYVDGQLVASRADVTSAQQYSGYWRLGGDTSWSGSSNYLNGTIDEAAVYPTALSAAQVANHYSIGTTGQGTNVPPTASFVSTVSGLTVNVDGSGSTDSDGTISSYAWDYGDGSTGNGASASHTYATAGTYPITLTVTDNSGATNAVTKSVTVTAPPPNVPPTAAFTATTAGLGVTFDGSGSTDSDGTVQSYAWNFGDGSTGTGVTSQHTYAAAGTYTVTLTVTDDRGGTGAVSHDVTVASTTSTALASDAFGRTSTAGWGVADTGGAWTISGGTSNATVSNGAGHLSIPTAGGAVAAYLGSVSSRDTAVQFDVSLPAAPTGGGMYFYAAARHNVSTDYRLGVGITPTGVVYEQIGRMVNGAETVLNRITLSTVTYKPGTVLTARFDVSGNGTSVLSSKVWPKGTPEPSGWQVTASDTTPALQTAGGVGIATYVSAAATALPVVLDVDNFWAGAAGTEPGGAPTNVAPTASFTSTVSGTAVSVDASGSSDPDGTIASYAWDFGDGGTANTKTASHTYAAAGTYTVTLTVTDNAGATGTTSKQVTVAQPNQPPTASFTSTLSGAQVSVDGSGSSDPDGTIASYAWDFGDGGTATGQTASHTYSTSGTYTVTLTVTDNAGATGTTSKSVTVSPTTANAAPTASFTSSVSGAQVNVDGSGSTDSDGSVVSWAWAFGDGGTATGKTASHTYTTSGTYSVTLTVTDNGGATGSMSKQVTVTVPSSQTVASDAFSRDVSVGLGSADIGGAWTIIGGDSNTSVSNGAAQISVPAPGKSVSAYLQSVSTLNTDVEFDASLSAPTTGGGMFVYAAARHSGSSDYRLGVGITPSGVVFLQLSKMVSGVETKLQSVTLPGLTYTPGAVLTVRFDVAGTGPTTLSGKAWLQGATEPAAWQVTATDSTASLQQAGGVGVDTYVSASATQVPVKLNVDNFWAGAAGTERPTAP